MPKSQAVNIREENQTLEITVDWYNDHAWVTLIFGIIWLLMLSTGFIFDFNSWSQFIPVLPHLLVGISLVYSGICLVANATTFRVQNGVLHVKHGPLPSWRGSRMIGVNEVEQLYFQERKKTKNKQEILVYTLHAKLVDGSRKRLMYKSTLNKSQALEIERKLEEYLGITDQKVWGEFDGKVTRSLPEGPRPLRRSYADPALTLLYRRETGEEVTIKGQTMTVEQVWQMDWSDHSTDRQLQLIADGQPPRQLYISQHKTFLHAFDERKIDPVAAARLGFRKDEPVDEFSFQGESYQLSYQQQGQQFPGPEGEPSLWIQQWTYETADRSRHIRITNVAGKLAYHLGELFHYELPMDQLELGELPEEEIEYRQGDWRNKDFV